MEMISLSTAFSPFLSLQHTNVFAVVPAQAIRLREAS